MSNGPGEQPPEAGEAVGSVGEEAAKLFGALSEWAHDHDLGGNLGNLGEGVRGVAEHVDTGAPECDWCPVCRTVHLVRTASPEVRDHLSSAAASLLQAAAGFLTATGTNGSRNGQGVERIDLDDEAEWPEEER